MKNISLLLILLITGFTSVDAQKVVKTELYEIFYSELFEQPISVKYSYPNPFEFVFTREVVPFKVESVAITAQVHAQAFQVNKIEYSENIGSYVDGNGNFTKNKIYDVDTDNQEISFPTATTTKIDTVITKKTSKDWKVPLGIHTSDKDDYFEPYHRGHLVPNASFTDSIYDNILMSYVNCAIMHHSLNQGLWLVLEKREREISKEALLKVQVIVSFTPPLTVTDGGATTPAFFTKILEYRQFDENENEMTKREVYCFPNNATVKGRKISDYIIKDLSY
jgi:DNA/RNA endonuclease G (NUC1)